MFQRALNSRPGAVKSRNSTPHSWSTTPVTRRSFRAGSAPVCRDGAKRCSRSCTITPSAPAPISRSRARRSWKSASSSKSKRRMLSRAPRLSHLYGDHGADEMAFREQRGLDPIIWRDPSVSEEVLMNRRRLLQCTAALPLVYALGKSDRALSTLFIDRATPRSLLAAFLRRRQELRRAD